MRLAIWIKGLFLDGDESTAKDASKQTPRELKDLSAQGMTSRRELLHLELAMFLGRTSPDSGIELGTYAGLPNTMVDAKLAIKQKQQTINDVIEKCRAANSLRQLDTFFTELSSEMSEEEEPCIQVVVYSLPSSSSM